MGGTWLVESQATIAQADSFHQQKMTGQKGEAEKLHSQMTRKQYDDLQTQLEALLKKLHQKRCS